MYSDELRKALEKAHAKVGDYVLVKKGERNWKGLVLPRAEENPDFLVLKLDSGYNVGIRYEPGMEITRLERPKQGIRPSQGLIEKRLEKQGMAGPVISILHTGGTIASKVDYETGGVSAGFTDKDLLQSVPEIFEEAKIRSRLLFNIMSEDMNYKHWKRIARAVVDELQESHGVVIAHGTDTLGYTSAALSFMVQDLWKPVVLVGSQRSSDRPSSDAFMNLLGAVRAAKLDVAGVFVCMHETISDESLALIRGTRARKMHTSRRDAFKAVNDKPVARIFWDGKVEFLQEPRKRKNVKPRLDDSFEPRVSLLKIHPNFSPEMVDFLVDKGYRGIVFEGTGLGHLPISDKRYGLLSSVERAIDSGVFVGMTSQCLYGRVHPHVYANLRRLSRAGVVFLEDMIPETAFVKLGWVLGHDVDLNDAKKMMLANYAGEISKRSGFD